MLSVKKGSIKYHFLSLWYDLGLNPGPPDNWWTLYPQDQWAGLYVVPDIYQLRRHFDFTEPHCWDDEMNTGEQMLPDKRDF